MAQSVAESEQISVPQAEQNILKEVEHFIVHGVSTGSLPPALVGLNGSAVELPASVFHLLQVAVHYLAQGQAITLVPIDRELTTQQAADLLNISRPYLVKLLEQGEISYTKTGSHRRIRFMDLMTYKARRDGQRAEALTDLTQLSQQLGLYDYYRQSEKDRLPSQL